jgi:hypothetical protein
MEIPTTIAHRLGSGKLLLTLASTVILASESRGTHDSVLMSHDSQLTLIYLIYTH